MTESEARKRLILPDDFAPCAEAFIDRRNPNSDGKLNYSFIGAGVAQSDKQAVNLAEPHGFQIGGVSLPPGRVNNLHLHFTAEVFICFAGEWEFIWGNRGEHRARIFPGDVFTIPTWIFRGFINRGGEDAFLFAALGQDDAGGIIWHPQVLSDAENAGLRLTKTNRVADVGKGESGDWMPPMSEAALAQLADISPAEMARFIVRHDSLDWRDDAMPDCAAASGACARLAPVIGYGMSASRRSVAPVCHPHSFSMDWLRLPPGAAIGGWRLDRPQVFIAFAGAPLMLAGDDEVELAMPPRAIFSAPPNSRRALRNDGDEDALLLLINGGDSRIMPEWDEAVLRRSRAGGWVLDPGGYLAPAAALACAGLNGESSDD